MARFERAIRERLSKRHGGAVRVVPGHHNGRRLAAFLDLFNAIWPLLPAIRLRDSILNGLPFSNDQCPTGFAAMDASYFRNLARRCNGAARECFDLCAKEEFRLLGEEFTQKADELEGLRPIVVIKPATGARKGERE